MPGTVPEFRASERDRLEGVLEAAWLPVDGVRLMARATWLRDATPVATVSGPGDLSLGTWARLYDGPLVGGVAWWVKLPNARDEGELGTDETDVTIVGTVGRRVGYWHLAAVGGLSVLGNPLRFANQDDVPLGWLELTHTQAAFMARARAGGGFETSRNPARLEASLGAEVGCPWFGGAQGSAGLTPAAPDYGVRLTTGWRWGCGG